MRLSFYKVSGVLACTILSVLVSAKNSNSQYSEGHKVFISFNLPYLHNGAIAIMHICDGFNGADGKEDVERLRQFDMNYEKRRVSSMVHEHSVTFELLNVDSPWVVNVDCATEPKEYSIHLSFIVNSGDSIIITQRNGELAFTGRHAKNYECRYELEKVEKNRLLFNWPRNEKETFQSLKDVDSLEKVAERKIRDYKKELSDVDYWLILANTIERFQSIKYGLLNHKVDNGHKLWERLYEQAGDSMSISAYGFSSSGVPEIVLKSRHYLDYCIQRFVIDSCYNRGMEFDLVKTYKYFCVAFDGPEREYIIYKLVSDNVQRNQDIAYCINNSMSNGYINNTSIQSYLSSLTVLLPGSVGYEYQLPDTTGKTHYLSDLRGKVVLIDTWHKPCAACIAAHPIIDSIQALFPSEKFVVVSICVDYIGHGKSGWKDLIMSGKYTSPRNINLLVERKDNLNTGILDFYQIDGDPSFVIIDKNGFIAEQPDNPIVDRGASMVRIIEANILK